MEDSVLMFSLEIIQIYSINIITAKERQLKKAHLNHIFPRISYTKVDKC